MSQNINILVKLTHDSRLKGFVIAKAYQFATKATSMTSTIGCKQMRRPKKPTKPLTLSPKTLWLKYEYQRALSKNMARYKEKPSLTKSDRFLASEQILPNCGKRCLPGYSLHRTHYDRKSRSRRSTNSQRDSERVLLKDNNIKDKATKKARSHLHLRWKL